MLKQVDSEKLYQQVLRVQGVKHPIIAPEKLNETADYIKSEFEKYGLETREQKFTVDGFDFTFRNIEGSLNESSEPEMLITSHYDTVETTPGANDNGSGIAGMLEAARVLAETETSKNIRFISFTLEEQNPARILQTKELAEELGLMGDNYHYRSWRTRKLVNEMFKLRGKALRKGTTNAEVWELIIKELQPKLTEKEKEYFELYKKLYSQDTRTSWLGRSALIGSSRWVEKALKEQRKILGVINLETIGYTSTRKHSQRSPMGFLTRFFPRYKVNIRKGQGNFIAITADKNSKRLAKTFRKQCKIKTINLPYLCAQIPFLNFEGIAKRALDVLRSDHGPFWRVGIPAIMLTDTANFRYPYYHTRADTIDKLDFDFIKKVTQATIATTIQLTKN